MFAVDPQLNSMFNEYLRSPVGKKCLSPDFQRRMRYEDPICDARFPRYRPSPLVYGHPLKNHHTRVQPRTIFTQCAPVFPERCTDCTQIPKLHRSFSTGSLSSMSSTNSMMPRPPTSPITAAGLGFFYLPTMTERMV